MLLIFGITSSAKLLATVMLTCRRCGNHATHEILEVARKFSLFFIPLFRVGAAQYLDTCTVCGLQTPITEAEARSGGTSSIPAPPAGPQDAATWTPQDRR